MLEEENVEKLDGAILDFGVSSHQIDDPGRGFSYRAKNAPLDMRMNESASLTAEIVVNTYEEERLYKIIKDYGEEAFARQIARNVVKARAEKPLKTCGELAEIVEKAFPQDTVSAAPRAKEKRFRQSASK